MSGYFGALMRSAGIAPAPMSHGGDLVEQRVEVEAAAPGRSAPPSAPAGPAAAESPAEAHEDRPAASDETATPPPPHAATDRHDRPGNALPAPFDPRAYLHPAVQAALQWVAADPAATVPPPPPTAEAPGTPRSIATADDGRATRPAATRTPSAADGTALWFEPQRHDTAPAHAEAARPSDVRPLPAAAPNAPAAHAPDDLSFVLPPPPRPRSTANDREPTMREPHAVEVSIGSLHVRIDAPPPRAVVHTAVMPPPPRPASTPPRRGESTSRGAFARARLPRI